jgi:hypothetical protein
MSRFILALTLMLFGAYPALASNVAFGDDTFPKNLTKQDFVSAAESGKKLTPAQTKTIDELYALYGQFGGHIGQKAFGVHGMIFSQGMAKGGLFSKIDEAKDSHKVTEAQAAAIKGLFKKK